MPLGFPPEGRYATEIKELLGNGGRVKISLWLLLVSGLASCASQKYRAEAFRPSRSCESGVAPYRAEFGKWEMMVSECAPYVKIEVWDRRNFFSDGDPAADERKWQRIQKSFDEAQARGETPTFTQLQDNAENFSGAYTVRIGEEKVQFLGTGADRCYGGKSQQVVLMAKRAVEPRWKETSPRNFSLENPEIVLRAWSLDPESGLFSEHRRMPNLRCWIETPTD